MLFFTIALFILDAMWVAAFCVPLLSDMHRTPRMTLSSRARDEDDPIDIDEQIWKLNELFGIDDRANDILITTSKRRQNLEREIELLNQLHPDYLLEESNPESKENGIIAEFWSIWYGECGASNERILREFEEELVGGGPNTWPEGKNMIKNGNEHYVNNSL
jgi:hypothetical protein